TAVLASWVERRSNPRMLPRWPGACVSVVACVSLFAACQGGPGAPPASDDGAGPRSQLDASAGDGGASSPADASAGVEACDRFTGGAGLEGERCDAVWTCGVAEDRGMTCTRRARDFECTCTPGDKPFVAKFAP